MAAVVGTTAVAVGAVTGVLVGAIGVKVGVLNNIRVGVGAKIVLLPLTGVLVGVGTKLRVTGTTRVGVGVENRVGMSTGVGGAVSVALLVATNRVAVGWITLVFVGEAPAVPTKVGN